MERFPKLTRFAMLSMLVGGMALSAAAALKMDAQHTADLALSNQKQIVREQAYLDKASHEKGVERVIGADTPDQREQLEAQSRKNGNAGSLTAAFGAFTLTIGLGTELLLCRSHRRRHRHEMAPSWKSLNARQQQAPQPATPETVIAETPQTETPQDILDDIHAMTQSVAPKHRPDTDLAATLRTLKKEAELIRADLQAAREVLPIHWDGPTLSFAKLGIWAAKASGPTSPPPSEWPPIPQPALDAGPQLVYA